MPRPEPTFRPVPRPEPKLKKESARNRSMQHEDRWAEALGGKRVKGSGSWGFRPGDVKADTHLLEHKFTKKKSYAVNVELLEKITKEADRVDRPPLFGITFETASGCEKDWVLVSLSLFQRLLER